MTKDEALRLALEALETSMYPQQKQLQAITAIKAALEAKDEPVAIYRAGQTKGEVYHVQFLKEMAADEVLLYAAPVQRTWVGLTDKDWNRSKHNYDFQKGVDWAESILKEKNT
jgi:hypothetical protein